MGNSSSKRGEQANTTPTGLYEHCEWDPKVVRRLILERKLAPITLGKDETTEVGLEECPICFLYYAGGLNRARCCRKGACTECYLQVKRPNQTTTCPFCNHVQYIVTFSGPLTQEEIAQEAKEQQKVVELKLVIRNEEIERDRQRIAEKERLRKEQELSGYVPPPPPAGNTIPANALRTAGNKPHIPQSAPSNPHYPPFGGYGQQYYGSSYPGSTQDTFVGNGNLPESDLDDLMLMEAIRLSLLDVQPTPEASHTATPNPPIPSDSSDSEDNYSSDNSYTLNSTTTTHTIPNTTFTSTTNTSTTNTESIPSEPTTKPTVTDTWSPDTATTMASDHTSTNMTNMNTIDTIATPDFNDTPITTGDTTGATCTYTTTTFNKSQDPTEYSQRPVTTDITYLDHVDSDPELIESLADPLNFFTTTTSPPPSPPSKSSLENLENIAPAPKDLLFARTEPHDDQNNHNLANNADNYNHQTIDGDIVNNIPDTAPPTM